MRILIIRLSALGDIVHALPLAAAIKSNLPSAEVSWLVEPAGAKLLKHNRFVDHIHLIDTKQLRRQKSWWDKVHYLRKIFADLAEIRNKRFDVTLEAQGLIKTGLLAYLSKAQKRIGFTKAICRESQAALFTNTHVPFAEKEAHIIEKNLALLEPIGIINPTVDFGLQLPDDAVQYVDKQLAEMGLSEAKLIGLHPGAAWETKLLPDEIFTGLASMITKETAYRPMVLWGPGEEDMAKRIVKASNSHAVMAPQTTVPELMALLTKLKAVVGPDTGPVHLAAALEVPCLVYLGPTHPIRNGPYGEGHRVIYDAVHCSPCHKRKSTDMLCIAKFSAERFFDELRKMI